MTRRQLAVLWLLGVLVVAVVAALGFVFSRAARTQKIAPATAVAAMPATSTVVMSPPALYRLPETSYTARNLYGQVEPTARHWQPDAALVSAATTWPFVSLDNLSKPVDWTFQFYSPSTTRVYVINVNDTGVTPIRETLSAYSVPTVDAEQWSLDSYQALNAWLNRGGGDFLQQHPIVDLSIRLAQSQEGAPLWTVLGIDESGQATLTEQVDAYEGGLP